MKKLKLFFMALPAYLFVALVLVMGATVLTLLLMSLVLTFGNIFSLPIPMRPVSLVLFGLVLIAVAVRSILSYIANRPPAASEKEETSGGAIQLK